jgi:hypothetical protein
MALPIILVNSATGSDSAASGAGPSTALTGVAGITSASGLVVVLDGSPDLTNVATDGSHVLFMSDTNAGSRNFSKITAKANSGTPTAEVTVADAFQALNTDAWAIGGKRASIGSTTSKKLFDNNAAAGDAMPGWIVEMESGHTETIAASYAFRRGGSVTNGPIILRGTLGAGTAPLLTFSNNGPGMYCPVDIQYIQWRDFALRNSHATKTASAAFRWDATNNYWSHILERLTIGHETDKFYRGLWFSGSGNMQNSALIGSRVIHCADVGVYFENQPNFSFLIGNYIYNNGSHGVYISECRASKCGIRDNLIVGNAGVGLYLRYRFDGMCVGNTIDNNGSDGLVVDIELDYAAVVMNNIFSNNGGYGIRSDLSDATLLALLIVKNNNYYNNSAGASLPSTFPGESGRQTVDPGYVGAGSGDYRIGVNLKALGYPTGTIGNSSTTSYVDIGAAQREEAVGAAPVPTGFASFGQDVRSRRRWGM